MRLPHNWEEVEKSDPPSYVSRETGETHWGLPPRLPNGWYLVQKEGKRFKESVKVWRHPDTKKPFYQQEIGGDIEYHMKEDGAE